MEPHCLRIFFALNLMLMTTHAALPPEIYWKMMLPSTPMPKAITELLRGDKGHDKEISSQDNPIFLYAAKETQSQDQLFLSNLGTKEISSQDNPIFLYAAKETQSQDQLPLSNLGTKEISSQDNPIFLYAAKETQSQDQLPLSNFGTKEISSQDNPIFLYAAKEPQSQYQIPLSNLGTKEISSQDNPIFLYAAKETQSQDQLPLSNLGTKEISSQDNPIFLYAAKEPQSQYQIPLSNLGTKEISSQDNPIFLYAAKVIQSQDQLPISNLGTENISSQDNPLWIYVGKESQLPNEANIIENQGASNHHHIHEISSHAVFFQEYQLHSGNKFYRYLNKIRSSVPLLPRQITQQIPFSLSKMKEILEMLYVKPNSKNAEIVEKTIRICEWPAMNGEEKYCATSLESMMDFVTSKLGKNVQAMSTDVQRETKPQNLLVKDGVKKVADGDVVIACHPLEYPYVVFGCHKVQNTSAYFVPLEGEDDGVRVKAVALCHKDTSKWDPNHVAFQELKVKPGTVPLCHIFPEGNLLWVSK